MSASYSVMCLLNRLPQKCQGNMNVECTSFRYPASRSSLTFGSLEFWHVIPHQRPCKNTTTTPPHQLFGGFRLNMLFPSRSSSGKLRLLHLPVCSPNIFDGNPSRIDAKGSTNRVQGPSRLSYSIMLLTGQSSEHVSIAPMDEVRNISEQCRLPSKNLAI